MCVAQASHSTVAQASHSTVKRLSPQLLVSCSQVLHYCLPPVLAHVTVSLPTVPCHVTLSVIKAILWIFSFITASLVATNLYHTQASELYVCCSVVINMLAGEEAYKCSPVCVQHKILESKEGLGCGILQVSP